MKCMLLIGCLALETYLGSACAQQPASLAPVSGGGISGKVVETMNAGEYTYIRVDTGETNVWAAAPRFPVKVGDTAAIAAGMPMPRYNSKTLNRDFEVVYFTDRVAVNGASPVAGVAPELPLDHPPIGGQRAAAGTNRVDLSGIKRAEGGKTVAQVYAEKNQLGGKQVVVRGKVVRYHGGILGKNWIHLRDGTKGKDQSDDLTVTSDQSAEVGNTVLVRGVVAVDRDLGFGYHYEVLIEEASVTVE